MDIEEKRKEVRKLELQFNIGKLETRLLELDDEKIKINEINVSPQMCDRWTIWRTRSLTVMVSHTPVAI